VNLKGDSGTGVPSELPPGSEVMGKVRRHCVVRFFKKFNRFFSC
jgi:hypothetical protein